MENTCSREMTTIFIHVALASLTGISKVQCAGQFFQSTKDNLHLKKEEPVLTTEVFKCSREKTCTTLARDVKSPGKDSESNGATFSITKTKGSSLICFHYG